MVNKRFETTPIALRNLATYGNLNRKVKNFKITRMVSHKRSMLFLFVIVASLDISVLTLIDLFDVLSLALLMVTHHTYDVFPQTI